MVGTDPIVALPASEAAGALALSAEAGWNQTAADWRFMLERGQGVGVREGARWIGSALVLPLDGRTSWISMVLVAASHRRRGFGTALFRRCLETVDGTGAVAALDATELGRPVYAKLGFADLWGFTRWLLAAPPRASPPAGVTLRPATEADLRAIASLDASASGVRRPELLAHLRARAPVSAWIAEREGRAVGYALGRDGRLATQVGPVVAGDEATAQALIARAAPESGAAMIDVPQHHEAVARWLAASGADPARRFVRMARGAAPHLAAPAGVFAIAGPELG